MLNPHMPLPKGLLSSSKKKLVYLDVFTHWWSILGMRIAANVFSLPVFTREFCGKFMEELEHFQSTDFPKGRPNTMNRGGVS